MVTRLEGSCLVTIDCTEHESERRGLGDWLSYADAPLASDWSLASSFRANALHCGDGERKSADRGEAGGSSGVVRGAVLWCVRH